MEDKTEEILSWNRFKDTAFVFETREIIKYDNQGRKTASIELRGEDTNNYRFNLYKYFDVTTVFHYSKEFAMVGEIWENYEKNIIQYDERDNVIKVATSYDTNIYVYDSLNRLQFQFYSEAGFHDLLNYFYDGDKLVRVQGHHTESNDEESEIKYYGTKRIITTTDSENNVTKTLEEYDEKGNCILQISDEYPENTYIQIITIEYYE
ncbi:MAG: hypothetical protein IJ759_02670 [Bacteroidales bacterium]|nr:hypothetical protein [Bacteroidales bacterium]